MKQEAESGQGRQAHVKDAACHAATPPQETAWPNRKLSKEEINNLPLETFKGDIRLARSGKEMLAAVQELRKESILGFDTEKRPSFKKGESHPPALVQLAGHKVVWIFRLRELGLPVELAGIFSDPGIIKAGVANGRDVIELRTMRDFLPGGFVDLGASAAKKGIQHHGLRGLAAVLLGRRISKGARLTNWERPNLPESALRYAATDAWIGRRIYLAMKEHGCV